MASGFYDPDSDDGRGYDSSSSSSSKGGKGGGKNKWWWDDYNYDYRDYSYRSGSGSRSWMSKIGYGYGDDYWKPKKDANEVYEELLGQLQNSANLIGDDSRGGVNVRWSNGQNVNDINKDSRDIYLSPDNVLTDSYGRKEVSEEVLDALTGKVYLASTLRETVSEDAYNQSVIARKAVKAHAAKTDPRKPCACGSEMLFGECCGKKIVGVDPNNAKNALTIWEAVETSIARNKIMSDWSGFGPYVANDAKRSSATKQEVQDYIDATVADPTTEAASLAIAWNLLNSSDPVVIPECYNDCIDAACEMMENEIDAEDRFQSCDELSKRLSEIIKTKDGGKSDGGSRKSDSPSVCDSSLLGDTVENKTDKDLSYQDAESSASEDGPSGDKPTDIKVPPPSGCSDIGKKYDLVPLKISEGHEEKYRSVVKENSSKIRAIRSSLLFRNNVDKMLSYGHRSGDIDENSLFKIRLDDDRVMSKTDVTSAKKIAICMLVDESGSMGCSRGSGKARYESARDVAIILAEGLRGMEGIGMSIYGHSAEEGSRYRGVTIREYHSPRQKNMAACMEIRARCQNHDSYAILHTANLFNRDYGDYDRKIIFVISDGEPGGGGYGGPPAMKHMLTVSQACEKRGIEVYGIGIDNAFTKETGRMMYGDNRFVVLEDTESSLGVMSRFIRQIAMKR